MSLITCEYCGTEYDEALARCPLCGTPNDQAPAPEEEEPAEEYQPRRGERTERKKRGGARAAKNEDKIPTWLSVLICIVLGLAVIIGAVYALYALGVFSPKSSNNVEDDPALTLPIDDDPNAEDPQTAPQTPQEPEEVACTGVTVTPASVSMEDVDVTVTVTARTLPSDCTEEVRWSSSDETVCTVDQKGRISSVAVGTATVTAQCGDFSADVDVIVNPAPVLENNAVLSVVDFTLFATGEQATIQVRNAPDNAQITWSTSNPAVCTVENGVVTAVKAGTATVTADVAGKKLECVVRCNIEGSVVANPGNAETGGSGRLDHDDVTLQVGESFEISVVGGVSGGWNVSDSSVITVDALGNVTALGKGTATVYTVVGGQRLECTVRVH